MSGQSGEKVLVKPVIADQLYSEALKLAEDSRAYFAAHSKGDRSELGPIDRVLYTAESLRISTRLMHVISWAMVRKAYAAGEITRDEASKPERQLEELELCNRSDPRDLRKLPRAVVILSHQSLEMYQRALRLQNQLSADQEDTVGEPPNPVAGMLLALEGAMEPA